MFCVIQTPSFDVSAKNLKLTDDEIHNIVTTISENPKVGALISGTGGARKWRVPTRQKGKRSGYRVVSYFSAADVPVFLLDIFAKGEKINLTKQERNQLKGYLADVASDYRKSVTIKVSKLRETGS